MLIITVLGEEFYNEVDETFLTFDNVQLELEHSLLSMSKWESKFKKPFLSTGAKTTDEIFGYVRAMLLTPEVGLDVLGRLSVSNLMEVQAYIEDSQTATTFGELPEQRGRKETITTELIYYWMVAFNIPFECETWHVNRLFALIRICNIKNSDPKKRSKQEISKSYAEINAERRAKLGTTG